MKLIHTRTGGILLGMVLAGCATTAPSTNLNLIPSDPILESDSMPSQEELNGKPLNVLTVAPSVDHVLVNKYKLNEQLPGKVEKAIIEGGASVVDRKLASALMDEIELAEETGNYGTYNGPKVSDLVMVAKLTNAAFSKDFNESHYGKDLITGKQVLIPAKCKFKADIEGFLEVRSLPNMALVDTIQFSETETNISDTRNSACPIGEQAVSHMLSTAMSDAFSGGKTSAQLKSAVAAKAYIVDKKSDGKTTFFKTTLKRSLGAKEGKTVRLYIIDEESGELQFIGDGTITSQEYITEKFSYIYLNDEKIVPMIRKGMVVKLFEECGMACKLSDGANTLNSLL